MDTKIKNQAEDFTKRAIATTLVTNKDKIITLFKKHGVAVDKTYSDPELIVGLLQATRTNARFKDDLSKVLAEVAGPEIKSNFTGEENFWNQIGGAGTIGLSAINPASFTNTPASTKQKTSFSDIFSGDTIKNIFNTGLGILSSTLTAKGNQKLAETAKEIEIEKTKQAALAASKGSSGGTQKSLSTGAKIAIAILIIGIAGTVTWLIVKKKK